MLHAELLGQRQPNRIDVGDHDLARADALRHQRAHDADRSAAGHQHVLADQIEGQGRVDGVAQRVEDRGNLVRNVVGDRHDIVLRKGQIFAESAGPVDADAQRVAAQMPPARPAVAAMAADDVAFARDALADLVFRHRRAEIGHRSDEFMAGHHRHRNGLLRPLVPVVDMHVGAADRRLLDLDQHIVRADLRHRHLFHPDARFGLGLHQRPHHVRHCLVLRIA